MIMLDKIKKNWKTILIVILLSLLLIRSSCCKSSIAKFEVTIVTFLYVILVSSILKNISETQGFAFSTPTSSSININI